MNRKMEETLNEEGIVRKEPANWWVGEDNWNHGQLILTTKRILFIGDEILDNDEAADLEIDLDTINTIAQETYVVDKNILSLSYLQYETAKFSVLNYEEWETAIESARMVPDIPGDPNKEPEIGPDEVV